MEKKKIVITKDATEFELDVSAGLNGSEVEMALAYAICAIADRQRKFQPDFKTDTLIEKIKGWVKCLQ